MPIAILPAVLAIGSGVAVGLVLGLVGGGGSILAVPLLVYVVGVLVAPRCDRDGRDRRLPSMPR